MIILVINIHSISFSILTYETYEKHVVFFFFAFPLPALFKFSYRIFYIFLTKLKTSTNS